MSQLFSHQSLLAISPLDGRYCHKTVELQHWFSEFALIKYRLMIEIRWLCHLGLANVLPMFTSFSKPIENQLIKLYEEFAINDAIEVKKLELSCHHDVKAVEYFLRQKMNQQDDLQSLSSFIHFACTSEDINNLAYGYILHQAREQLLLVTMDQLIHCIEAFASRYKCVAMLARTHGQVATPTTLGKEMAIFVTRLSEQRNVFSRVKIKGKFNGASGNYNAHVAYSQDIDWPLLSKQFIESLGLCFNPYTTQIESHDYIAELMHALMRFNTVLLDLAKDIWSYISFNYLKQKPTDSVGSSTMPHKINPINFENAEGNLGLANAIMQHIANKLPISRLQRDLSDSTVLRNLGVGFAHSLIAYQELITGFDKLLVNEDYLAEELNQNWQILAEAIQTVMRGQGIDNAYEQLQQLTQNHVVDKDRLREFIKKLDIETTIKQKLLTLQPDNYLGLATLLTDQALTRTKNS